jgi:hypothetical protein
MQQMDCTAYFASAVSYINKMYVKLTASLNLINILCVTYDCIKISYAF